MQLNSKVYDVLKQVVQVYIPGLAALYFGLASIWHFGYAEQVTGSAAVVATFLGLALKISSKAYEASGDKYAGTIHLVDSDEGSAIHLTSVDPVALTSNSEVTFKVVNAPPGVAA